jgi:hypothetical protein
MGKSCTPKDDTPFMPHESDHSHIANMYRKLASENKRLRIALEFYADRNNWKCFDSYSEVKDVITISDISAKNHETDTHGMISSGGNRARIALAIGERVGK